VADEKKAAKPAKKDVPEAAKRAAPAAEKKAAAKPAEAPKKKVKKAEADFAAYVDTEAERSSIQVPILDEEGKEKRVIHLPLVFAEPVRTDLIARAVQASRANRRQPYGAPAEGVWAGRRHSTEWSGKGKGISRVQRLKDSNRGATSPNNVGGARAHPPRVVQNRGEKVNIKERRKARRSALAALARADLVKARGHRLEGEVKVPIIVESRFETLWRRALDAHEGEGRTGATNALVSVLNNLGIGADLERARDGTHQRAGRGKMRGRRWKVPRSVLLVVENEREISRAARNVPGVEVVSPKRLSTEALAPGGSPGRLAVISESALTHIKGL
jgi:large subunit ribosomal protein L4e